jgi:CubicO group peptidase (beta-lactamase class C family)
MDPSRVAGDSPEYNRFAAWYVLAAIVERVTGERVDRVCQERVLDRLAGPAYFSIPVDRHKELAPQLVRPLVGRPGSQFIEAALFDPAVLAARDPAAGGIGSMTALASFYDALVASSLAQPGAPFAHEAVRFMLDNRRGRIFDGRIGRRDLGLGIGIGMRDHINPARQPSPGSFGHVAFYGNTRVVAAFGDPNDGIAGAIYVNTRSSSKLMGAIVDALYVDLRGTGV